MKRILLVGNIGCGKTTLCQAINGMALDYKKTQAIEVINRTIDTPGEYLEQRGYLKGLRVTSVETDLVLFLQEAAQLRFMYSPGLAAAFPVPVAGVVTKIDISAPGDIKEARELLALAGADPVFEVSATTGEGLGPLLRFLDADGDAQ